MDGAKLTRLKQLGKANSAQADKVIEAGRQRLIEDGDAT